MIDTGQLVMLISPKGKRYLRVLDPSGDLHTHDGKLSLAQVAETGFGGAAKTHLGIPYRILKPTVYDLIKGVKRHTQIMYPKEIGYILLKMGIGPGARVVEAGSGSGGLTLALAYAVGDTGRVHTHERREEFHQLAQKNLARVGLDHRVEFILQDVDEGFAVTGADALFLDVRTPWEVIRHIPDAVIPGAMCGFLLPTINQVSNLLDAMEDMGRTFVDTEVLEVLIRRWKPVPERMRPEDRMVAHTGFLVFARCMGDVVTEAETPEPTALPDDAETESGEDAVAPDVPGDVAEAADVSDGVEEAAEDTPETAGDDSAATQGGSEPADEK